MVRGVAGGGGMVPPIMVWLELRGGAVRRAASERRSWKGVVVAEVSMVLALRPGV